MSAVALSAKRASFERLVADTVRRPVDPVAVRAQLAGQALYGDARSDSGLDELAEILTAHVAAPRASSADQATELARRHPRQPLCHLYSFAAQRERGESALACHSLEALRALDPADPMAEMFALAIAGEPIPAASESQRLANIAKLAATSLLRNPYQLAVGSIFDAIRGRAHARVLDIGVGSGAQMVELIRLLAGSDHQVKRLELVGLDFVDEFLHAAGEKITAAASPLASHLAISFEPVHGKVETLDRSTIEQIRGQGLDAANATIALHEVPGEKKLTALEHVRELAPQRLMIAEWNYCLEDTLPETSTEFVFNVRSVAAAIVAALRERHALGEARGAVRDWLSQGGGQLTIPAAKRQECFLDASTWRALLDDADFTIVSPHRALLGYAKRPEEARIHADGCWIETSRYCGAVPIALILASASR